MVIQKKSMLTVVLSGLCIAEIASANPGAGKAAQAGVEAVNGVRGALRLGTVTPKAPVANVPAPVSAVPLVTLPAPTAAQTGVGSSVISPNMATSQIQDNSQSVRVNTLATASGERKLQELKVAFSNIVSDRAKAGDISNADAGTLNRAFDLGVFKNTHCLELSQEAVRNLSKVTAYAVGKLEGLGTNLFVVDEAGLAAVAEEWVSGMMRVLGQNRESAIERTIGLSQSCGLNDRIGGMAASLN